MENYKVMHTNLQLCRSDSRTTRLSAFHNWIERPNIIYKWMSSAICLCFCMSFARFLSSTYKCLSASVRPNTRVDCRAESVARRRTNNFVATIPSSLVKWETWSVRNFCRENATNFYSATYVRLWTAIEMWISFALCSNFLSLSATSAVMRTL